jgi:outer membrane protein assembly factor BamA
MLSINNNPNLSKLILFLLFICVAVTLQAQDAQNKTIEAIVIIGNKTTGENVIRRELLFSEGDFVSEDKLRESQERLLNLYLFNRVEMYSIPQENNTILVVIEVTEQLYFYPIPLFDINERDWGKLSYGLSVVHSNFRGQNEDLWLGAWFGYRPGYGFSYSDQWAGDSLHLATSLNFSKVTFDHHTLGFEERHIFADASVGKWWNLYLKTELTLAYDRISVDPEISPLLFSQKATEHLWSALLSLRYDTRNIYAYPESGWYTFFSILKNGLFQKYNNYYRLTGDIRKYIPIGSFILAGRFYQSNLFDQIPIYRLNYIGFNERIRGHFYDVREGKHVQVASLALRFPIIPIHYLSFVFPGIPNPYLKNLKIGLNGGFFIDSGIVWGRSHEYGWNNFKTGFGFGLHLRMPYVEVFRIDYAFDRQLDGQFIAEIGIAF